MSPRPPDDDHTTPSPLGEGLSEDLSEDLAPLIHQWKELDMNTLSLAVDTGRLYSHARGLRWMMRGLLVLQLGFFSVAGWQMLSGNERALTGFLVLGAGLILFVPCMIWQARTTAHAEQALGGTTTAMLEARRRLLDAAIADIQSPWAKVVMVASGLFTAGLFAAALVGELPLALPAVMAVLLAGTYTWSLTRRLPRLLAERDAVVALQEELAG